MTAATPSLEYLAMPLPGGKHGVFVVSDAAPDWYRLIALFHSKERAEQYAEIEMMSADDDSDGQWNEMQRAETANVPIATCPPSAITVGNFVRREAVGKAAPSTSEEITHAPNEIKEIAVETAPEEITLAPPQSEPTHPSIVDGRPLVDAATLAPLTSKQAEIFGALCRLSKTSGAVRARHIAMETSYASVNDALYSIEKKGFCAHTGDGDHVFYRPLASGTPNIEDTPKTGHKAAWTQEEIDGIAQLDASKGDSYEAYGKKIGRTVNAVTSMAYSREIFRRELRYPEPVQAKADPPKPVVEKTNGHAVELSPAAKAELARPAPVKPKDKPETRVSSPVVRRVDTTALPRAHESVTAELTGDPTPGRSAADNAFDPKTYLIRKGHTVSIEFGGRLRVDGKCLERGEVIDLVNSYRVKADLPPIAVGAMA